jgi:hypothetical protein
MPGTHSDARRCPRPRRHDPVAAGQHNLREHSCDLVCRRRRPRTAVTRHPHGGRNSSGGKQGNGGRPSIADERIGACCDAAADDRGSEQASMHGHRG